MKRDATALIVALTSAVAACGPTARSTAYFDAHPGAIDAALEACASGARGEECDAAVAAKAHRATAERMSVYRKTFEAVHAR